MATYRVSFTYKGGARTTESVNASSPSDAISKIQAKYPDATNIRVQ